MKVQVWTIGKAGEKYIEEGIKEYSNRLKHYTNFELKIITPPKDLGRLPVEQQKLKEAALVEAQLQTGDFLVLLDERGKSLSTVQLADKIQQWSNAGTRRVIFLIGGAFGIDDSLKQKAGIILTLSAFTFPHQLVRLIITEQIYRAYTVINNEKYHHP